jgi:heterogeneous nuclear ribonucleoprotein F/H
MRSAGAGADRGRPGASPRPAQVPGYTSRGRNARQVHFFEGVEVVDGTAGVHMPKTPEGRPLGEAYVEFASEAELQEALQRDRNKVGSRYIELFVSSKAEMHQVGPPAARLRVALELPASLRAGPPRSAEVSPGTETARGRQGGRGYQLKSLHWPP